MYVACCVVFVYVHLSLSDLLLKKGFMFVNSFFVGIFVDLKVREGAFLGGGRRFALAQKIQGINVPFYEMNGCKKPFVTESRY